MPTRLTLALLSLIAFPVTGLAQEAALTAPSAIPAVPALISAPPPPPAPAYVAGQRGEQRSDTERSTRTLRLGATGEIQLSNIAGDIVIKRGGTSEAVLEIVKTARAGSTEEVKALLQAVQVDIVERNNRAEVKVRYPDEEFRRGNRRNVHVDVAYTLTAPEGTRVRASSISGSITSTGIKGDTTLEAISGTIRLANSGRRAAAKSISGNVEVTDTQMDGALEASTVSGTVTIRGVKAQSVEANSVSGSIVLDRLSSPRVEAQTISGDLKFSGPLTPDGHYELNSHSGELNVALSGDVGFEAEATSFSGSTRSDFPAEKGSDDGRRRRRGQALRVVHGNGSATLELSTFSGDIVVSKR
jgi:hypothetical protein